MVEAVLETAVRLGADLVLIQKPHWERRTHTSHPSFNFIQGGRRSAGEMLGSHQPGIAVDTVVTYRAWLFPD